MIRSVIQGVAQIQPNFLRQPLLSSTLRAVTTCDTQSIHPPDPYSQQLRTAYIVKRTNPLPLSKMHKRNRLMKGRHYLYEVIENTVTRKEDPLKVILTSSVEGLGSKGDIIETTPHRARNHLILPGLAVYASPENLEKYSYLMKEASTEDQASSPFSRKLTAELSLRIINVSMNMKHPWKIEPWHIRVAFRKAGIIVPEESITLPSQPIEGPDLSKQSKEFLVKVKINKKEEALVRCRVHHCTTVATERIPYKPFHFFHPAEPLFPEEGPILEELTSKHPKTIYEEKEE
ncbi:large ribosomal subunit protein bL9m [Macrobrachium rosenbergii]|uniref:large ribosomal subunit protein bL9m n=1 Tax=Macrobrachium rosenbergii TaxID=79674 RepID=UPI0034D74D3A